MGPELPAGRGAQTRGRGVDLRWSVDGKTLSWIAPRPAATWRKETWEFSAGEAETTGGVPARPEGTVWSPDGRLCAVVEEAGSVQQLVVYQAGSPVGETLEVEGLRPQRVLGWTPDSRIVVVLGAGNVPVAAAVTPEAALREDLKRALAKENPSYHNLRASVIGPPIDAEAGPPTWSANADMLAYVYDLRNPGEHGFIRWQLAEVPEGDIEGFLEQSQVGPPPTAEQALIAVNLLRLALPREEVARAEESALRTRVLSNVKNIAVALNMYLADYDAFPEALTGEELRGILRDYVKNDSLFCLPDTDEIVVQYLIPPGTRIADIEDAALTPMVVVGALPEWDIVGFVDGHAQIYRKGDDYGLESVRELVEKLEGIRPR